VKFTVERFTNQELHITLHGNAAKKEFVIKGLISPPEVNFFTFLILAHTLKIEGAQKIVGFIPYLAYARHEKRERHKSQLTALVGRLLAAAGVDEVIVVDVHSPLVKKLFPIPLTSLSPAPLFKKALGRSKRSFVAPDKGAIERCQDVAGKASIAWISKRRTARGVTPLTLHGTVTKKAVIIDDILDTGHTLISCCQKLHEQGVDDIIIMVTHGLFTGDSWKKLWKMGVKKIYCTDTIPLKKSLLKDRRIIILPISKLWTYK
jgi:ribose-phosphate pyrophosphokinase